MRFRHVVVQAAVLHEFNTHADCSIVKWVLGVYCTFRDHPLPLWLQSAHARGETVSVVSSIQTKLTAKLAGENK
jgi:hypothetical protein